MTSGTTLSDDRLENRLDYHFSDRNLLALALTHRSCGSQNNERLEFLGDALLNSHIAQLLYAQFPKEKEGMLSRLRAVLVKGETLAEIAREFDLSDHLILGEGERKSGGSRRDSILADAVEAIIGAIFIDAGMDRCQQFIGQIFKQRLQGLSIDKHLKDPKTRLQELLQARQLPLPVYTIVDIGGQDHKQLFSVRCDTVLLKDGPVANAGNRRMAEKMAAEKVLEWLESRDDK
ncbi:MAG: ribonuclease III [Pseudomonadota bacterium]